VTEPRPGYLLSPRAIHRVFVLGVPLMVLALRLVLLIPETPLRRSVREAGPTPSPA
jgi:hypothetical protein